MWSPNHLGGELYATIGKHSKLFRDTLTSFRNWEAGNAGLLHTVTYKYTLLMQSDVMPL